MQIGTNLSLFFFEEVSEHKLTDNRQGYASFSDISMGSSEHLKWMGEAMAMVGSPTYSSSSFLERLLFRQKKHWRLERYQLVVSS